MATSDDTPTVDEDPPPLPGTTSPWYQRAIVAVLGFRPDWEKWWGQSRENLPHTLRTFVFLDLRWSFLLAVIFIAVGGVAQLFMPHGWSVWPIVFCCSILGMLDEASDRNGVGVPPVRAVAFILGVLAFWGGLALFLKIVPLFVPLLGVAVAGYFAFRAEAKHRRLQALMGMRVANGQCAYCGEPFEPGTINCLYCGELVNPDGVRSTWSTRMAQSPGGVARTRAILKGEAGGVTARRKEQALLDRRYRPGKSKK